MLSNIKTIDAQVTMSMTEFLRITQQAEDDVRNTGEMLMMKCILKALIKDYDKLVNNLKQRNAVGEFIAEKFSEQLRVFNIRIHAMDINNDYPDTFDWEMIFNDSGNKTIKL